MIQMSKSEKIELAKAKRGWRNLMRRTWGSSWTKKASSRQTKSGHRMMNV